MLKSRKFARLLEAFCAHDWESWGNCVFGWGHKPTAEKARRLAEREHRPYVALEDGFLRSLDLGCRGAWQLSLVVDHTGIYYDATVPSDLENLLNSTGWETPDLLRDAKRALDDIVRLHLSKYNHAPDAPEDFWEGMGSPRVLLIDQTMGDASVSLGCADTSSFEKMLDEALSLYPAAA